MSSNSEYWRKRSEALVLLSEKQEKSFIERITKQFKIATKNIKDRLNRFYAQFAEEEGISFLEAKRLLNSEELEEFHISVDEYMELLDAYKETESKEIYQRLERASLKYRVTRLEAIELQLAAEVARAYTGVDDGVLTLLKDIYEERYYRSAFDIFKGYGIGVSFEKYNERELEMVLKEPWVRDGETFSERIWSNRDKLIENLETELSQSIIAGRSYSETAERLAKKMDSDIYKCSRVVATESAYFSSQAQKEVWNELGVEEYIIVATLDDRTSEICQNQDGTIYKTKDFKPGETAPPFHVNCRSTTAPYYDDSDLPGYIPGERSARDPKTHKTYTVPASMTYKEWYEKYVK